MYSTVRRSGEATASVGSSQRLDSAPSKIGGIEPPLSPCKRLWSAGSELHVDDDAESEWEVYALSSWDGGVVKRQGKRRYYNSVIKRDGAGLVTFSVGDDVLIQAPRGLRPYIAKIEEMFEDGEAEEEGELDKNVLLKWYYRYVMPPSL